MSNYKLPLILFAIESKDNFIDSDHTIVSYWWVVSEQAVGRNGGGSEAVASSEAKLNSRQAAVFDHW
ncbi:hypothetical protein GUITHDRAFT_150328 [Guillardia theta CCMP2712]|uniref:Uncharacterized protein n=1 Tax=Guillardia theta (strain CCMP2712) TaxID=905079 RepID=L1JZ96_GUITC|nr:hypothetical protein GUITHDRAFT_150328 [Guillardia theta CCMP2712]EKX53896.1 hypothetical protein GUITHDRAFT_150328 [Guillardia theta CCMP2712]|eukprot:XP_005840876.1 hypothetical protein GUITHDRAFT_150328 [Guillardia theta CCMP2712]